MEVFLYIFALCSPPFVAAVLIMLRRRSLIGYWCSLVLLAAPIVAYLIWASQVPYVDRTAPITLVAGAFLVVFCIALPLTSLWFISRTWVKVILAPVIYIAGLFLALVIGVNLGMFEA